MQPPTIDDIRAAAKRIEGAVIRTPMLVSRTLSEFIGAEVWLKFENLQFTAAYKERGALNKLLQLTAEERARGVIAASAGNHAQAVAYHAKRLGIPATIVMPATTPTVKVTQTEGPRRDRRALRRHVRRRLFHGRASWRSRRAMCSSTRSTTRKSSRARGRSRSRCSRTRPTSTPSSCPIGGGGLMSGVSIAARAVKPDIELIGVEAELYPSMKCAIQGVNLPLGGDTLAEGIAVKHPGALTSRILADFATEVVLVSERDLERAVAMLAGIEKSVVEGAGAAGLAAMLADPDRFKGKKVATILCGGNIDTHLLANVLVRDLVRQGRIARLRVAAHDQPGALAAITAKVYEAGRQRHRDQPQPDLHRAAGQGHADRGRMRGPRRRSRSTMSWRDSKRPDSGSSGRSLDYSRPAAFAVPSRDRS